MAVQFDLVCHPHAPMPGIACVRADIIREANDSRLTIRYRVEGDIAALALPRRAERARADGLWQATCFEAFVGVGDDPTYREFNFSPSSRWAAYQFTGYRAGRSDLSGVVLAQFAIDTRPDALVMDVAVDLAAADPAWRDADWRIGLSAILVDRDGTRSFWALAHPPGSPDFHHGHCFAGHLQAAARP